MRTKDDIMLASQRHITDIDHRDLAPLWLEVRKIEVLIDIRDILDKNMQGPKTQLEQIIDKL